MPVRKVFFYLLLAQASVNVIFRLVNGMCQCLSILCAESMKAPPGESGVFAEEKSSLRRGMMIMPKYSGDLVQKMNVSQLQTSNIPQIII